MQWVRSVISLTVVVTVALASLLFLSFSPVAAQGGDDACEQLVTQAVTSALEMCGDVARGDVCYGHTGVLVGGEGAALVSAGDRSPVTALEWVSTVAANPDANEWGVATAMLPAGLPEDADGVMAILFGDTQIARPAAVSDERPTLTVSNSGSSDINLRNGAGSVGYEVIGPFIPGTEAVADGRNEQADWVRIRYNDLIAWVFVPLISWEGDLQTLEVLLPNDITPPMLAGEPFEAFTLTTAADTPACAAAPSGLLLQYSGEETASLIVNGVGLDFSDATLLVTATPNESFDVKVMAGTVTVTARGLPEEATIGQAVSVNLGGDDGLTPLAQPDVRSSYAFPEIAYTPVDLLPGAMACIAGVPDQTSLVTLRVGPGNDRGELAQMSTDSSYPVLGWANDPDGNPWWELDTGQQTSWVNQTDVRSIGACDAVAQVEAPPVVFSPGAGAAGGQPASGPDLAPTANSVWQMRPGTDQLSGECSGAPAINFCDHLAAISPVAGGISWRGMEATPYVMSQSQPNVYSYVGPNALGTGTINMTLTFSSETDLNMTMTLTLDSEPNCQHTYFYTGTRNW